MFDRLIASQRRAADRPAVPSYPDGLRRTGTPGTVMVQLVIDTLGRAEPGPPVLQSSHPGFEAAARAYLLGALFRPGRTHGRAVRVLVRLPISFTAGRCADRGAAAQARGPGRRCWS